MATASTGLTAAEAGRRLREDGPNVIREAPGPSSVAILARQFNSPVVWLLLAAGIVAIAVGETVDGAAIAGIILLNGLVGFFQERRAERAISALRAMTAPTARVVRDGRTQIVAAQDIVRGDLLALEAGDLVAADARLIEADALTVNEAALTGESLPVEKSREPDAPDTPLAERRNHVFLGTAVATGAGRAEVCATSMATELGKIATLLDTADAGNETPLQRRLAEVTRMLVVACLGLVALVAALGWLRGWPAGELLLTAVSLAVAAVPEGLPAVVTIALAVGVQRMAARHVLVRRLPAVETLGCATVICTDKTGTLTTGVMTVRELWGADRQALLFAAAACCDAELPATASAGDAGSTHVSTKRTKSSVLTSASGQGVEESATALDAGVGDPTELAILRAAARDGIRREAIERDLPRVAVEPFDAAKQAMSITRANGVIYVKGAVEVILARAAQDVGVDAREAILRAHTDLAGRGLRVLAVAIGRARAAASTGSPTDSASDSTETRARTAAPPPLTPLGLIGMADPPRAEAIAAVAAAHRAGVTTVMITGDHPATARAIASELGIAPDAPPPASVPTPTSVSASASAFTAAPSAAPSRTLPAERVHARATPEDKLRIVREWKARGAVVAMTGDGVNDAPALREADIGIAMGRTGTQVTREASDMILTDDNFASIIAALGAGRGIFDNIRKTLVYLLAGNAAELGVMLLAVAAGLPLPLLPLHLLWINIVTDGLPALALVMDPPDDDLLARPPRRPDEPMLRAAEWRNVALTAALQIAVTLAAFAWVLSTSGLEAARSAAFAVLVFGELWRAFAARSATRLFWEVGAFTNLRLLAVVALSSVVQLLLHHLPATQRLFALHPLDLRTALLVILLALVPVTVLELRKLARRLGPVADPDQG